MSGGTWEYVMGVLLDESGNLISGKSSLKHSGFNGVLSCPDCDGDTSGILLITNGYNWPDKKYYDTYLYSTTFDSFGRRILGDATGEMGPVYPLNETNAKTTISSWYQDRASMIDNTAPLAERGGSNWDGVRAGLFSFLAAYGYVAERTFRIVLTPIV